MEVFSGTRSDQLRTAVELGALYGQALLGTIVVTAALVLSEGNGDDPEVNEHKKKVDDASDATQLNDEQREAVNRGSRHIEKKIRQDRWDKS